MGNIQLRLTSAANSEQVGRGLGRCLLAIF